MQPDVKLAMITSRNDTLVLFRGVWHPIEKIPAEYHDFAHSIAKPWFEFSGKSAETGKVEVYLQSVKKSEENCEELKKTEAICGKVKPLCSFTQEKESQPIDPTGTPVVQKCMGCGYASTEPYPATCPTCRNPYPVSMVLGVTWADFLQVCLLTASPQIEEAQLSLFGGVA